MTANVAALFAGVAAMGSSALLTALAKRYAEANLVLDIPVHRSSHAHPVPRGGGIAIAITILIGTVALWQLGLVSAELTAAVVGGGLPIALVGWVDDHRDVPAGWRALVHVAAAALAVAVLGGFPSMELGTTTLRLGVVGSVLAVLGLVWLTNLFNFMDGIDGIAAGVTAIAAAIGGGLVLMAGVTGVGAVAFLLAGASAGFLLWNWPPARIFMGDVGSGMLGFVFGVLALASEQNDALPLLGWMVLGGVFVIDATLTLLRRILAGEAWHEAHRSHAYQRAVQLTGRHRPVTVAAVLLTAALGLPAATALTHPSWFPLLNFVSLIVLILIYVWVERQAPRVT